MPTRLAQLFHATIFPRIKLGDERMYDEDFVNEEHVEFVIDGRKFSYKPVTAGEENDWINEYMDVNEKGEPKVNFAKLNRCKLRNIIKVPYDALTIQKAIGKEVAWNALDSDDRWNLFRKLKPGLFDKIIAAITDVDKPDDSKKKVLSKPSDTAIPKQDSL